jgi:lipopolysaccharide export system ATP-binding protein
MPLLEVQGLVKSFRKRGKVVDGVSFHVEKGEIVGLLGPNGAGKSTCFRMTCGMLPLDKGRVFLNGLDVTDWPMHRRARDGGMGYLSQEPSLIRKLTVEQNLIAMMELLGMSRAERRARCDELLAQFRIGHIRKSRAAGLSGGERRRLEIARCMVSDPTIIMLDEPFAGIDPKTVQSIQRLVCELRDEYELSILITDHAARETLQITDRSYVIDAGVVLCDGAPEEVLLNPLARDRYFGDNIGLSEAAPRRTLPVVRQLDEPPLDDELEEEIIDEEMLDEVMHDDEIIDEEDANDEHDGEEADEEELIDEDDSDLDEEASRQPPPPPHFKIVPRSRRTIRRA